MKKEPYILMSNEPTLNTELHRKDINILYLVISIILWLLMTLWIVEIFKLSAETGTESNARSYSLYYYLNSYVNFEYINEAILRKLAHLFEFSILSVIAFFAVNTTNKISPKVAYSESKMKLIKSDNEMFILISLWISTLYAILDEYHQLFVDGRHGSIADVGFDLIGIIPTLLIIRVIFTIYLRHLGKDEERYED